MHRSHRTRLVLVLAAPLALLACSDEGPPSQGTGDLVKRVIITNPNPDTVRALGKLTLNVRAFNASNVEVPRSSYVLHFDALDPDVVAIALSGDITAMKNGSGRVVARAGDGADTVEVVVLQTPTTIFFTTDTAVGLTADATPVQAGNTLGSVDLVYQAFVGDENHNVIPGNGPITWTSLDDTVFTLTQNTDGSVVTLHGVAPGLGFARATAAGITQDLPIQIAARYEPVLFSVTPDGTVVQPDPSEVLIGDAVVFEVFAGDQRTAQGNGWTTGVLLPGYPVGQIFADSGHYAYRTSGGADGAGTVIVDTLPHALQRRAGGARP